MGNQSVWWAMEDLNLRPPRCERGALTTELTALIFYVLMADSLNYRETLSATQPRLGGMQAN